MLAAEQQTQVFPLVALCLSAENSRPGHPLPNATTHQAWSFASSTSQQACAFWYDGTASDRLVGLDFFAARYMSSAQGRFTSPDEFKGGPVDPFTGQQIQQPGPLPYADITNPQSLNKYAYVLNNPLRYTDPDGHDINFASPRLEDLYNRLAIESPTFATELAADREPDPNFTVSVVERGLRQNDEKSSGDATATRTGPQVTITVYVDSYNRTSDSTVAHEQGHVKDARTNTNQFFKDGLATKKAKGSPGALAHNDRPEEKRADQFRDQFNKEQKAYQKAQKEQRQENQQRKQKKEEPQ